jgi:hypothetical protein
MKYNITFQQLQKPDIYEIFKFTKEANNSLIQELIDKKNPAVIFIFNSRMNQK